MNKSLDVLGRQKEMHKKRRKKYKDRGTSGFDQSMKERDKIDESFFKDLDLKERYGKDAPKSRSFGIDPTVAKDMNLSGELGMSKQELKEKFPKAGKKAGKTVKKKMMAGGKQVKKMMAGGKQVKKGYAAGKTVTKKMMSNGKLVGGQKKLDKDNDGKISGKDFAMLRGGKAKGGAIKKMAGGKQVKKMMAKGKMVKGGAKGGKKKAKVRGAGIARKGVRPAKMR